ncbi:hypothetical protein [Levilactobacillus brevis]|mgnify:FL=1|uniref:hypothetical protein n=1 Tax=Levilactobacillus brevis TaxID=1580 RepID=UPI00111A3E89|nr:hypothetical protein [Levilactobacillus brevis]QCZ42402.1 hypothetical protein UCCLBBS124_0040 [Levilactobacillus brevis]
MNKIMKITMTGITVLTLGGMTTATASAAAWHKGTPKALRSNWKRSYYDHGTKVTINFNIKSNRMSIARPGWALENWSNLKYQKAGSGTYKIKGTYHNGMLIKKNSHMKLVKKAGKVTYKNSWSSSYSYLGWFHK